MKCRRCDETLFFIEIRSDCGDCEHNGYVDCDEEDTGVYQFGKIPANEIERTMVEDEGECRFGSAFGEGCYMFTCKGCGTQANIALVGC